MSNKNGTTTVSGRGTGLFGLTFVALLVLKLGGWASISWLVVFLPLIIGFAISAIVLFIAIVCIWLAS